MQTSFQFIPPVISVLCVSETACNMRNYSDFTHLYSKSSVFLPWRRARCLRTGCTEGAINNGGSSGAASSPPTFGALWLGEGVQVSECKELCKVFVILRGYPELQNTVLSRTGDKTLNFHLELFQVARVLPASFSDFPRK